MMYRIRDLMSSGKVVWTCLPEQNRRDLTALLVVLAWLGFMFLVGWSSQTVISALVASVTVILWQVASGWRRR